MPAGRVNKHLESRLPFFSVKSPQMSKGTLPVVADQARIGHLFTPMTPHAKAILFSPASRCTLSFLGKAIWGIDGVAWPGVYV